MKKCYFPNTMALDSEALFGWLSDEDRRVIRALTNPLQESIDRAELPEVADRIQVLLNDPRNCALIQEAMPPVFLSFRQKVLSLHPTSETQTIRKFMSLYWLRGAVKQY